MSAAFVIQIHTGLGPTHYDLMIERGDVLETWQLSGPPTEATPEAPVPARKLPDHRRAYLTYEGPVSRGRGDVRILDTGACERLESDEGRVRFVLHGRRVSGAFKLVRRQGDAWSFQPVAAEAP